MLLKSPGTSHQDSESASDKGDFSHQESESASDDVDINSL